MISRIIKDFINDKIGYAVFKLSGLILTISLARLLGPSSFGIYTIFLSLANLFASFSSLSAPTAIVYYLNKNIDTEEKKLYFRYILYIVLFANLVLLFFLLLFKSSLSVIFLKEKNDIIIILSGTLSLLYSLIGIFKSVFSANKRFKDLRNLSIVESILKILYVVVLSYLFGTMGAIAGITVAYFNLLIIAFKKVRKSYKWLFSKIEQKRQKGINILKSLLSYLVSLSFVSASRSLYLWLDTLVISILLSPKEVAFYRVSLALITTVLGFSSTMSIFSPRFAEWDFKKINKYLSKIIIFNLLISIPASIAFYFLSPFIVEIIYGKEYLSAVPLLKIGSVILILNAFSVFTAIFNLKGYPLYTVFSILLGAFVNAIADYIFIIKYGLIGAIYATIIAWVVSLCASVMFYIKLLKKEL